MKKLLILTILILGFFQVKSQTIEIGQEAEYIKRLIEWSTKDHNRPDSYGNYSTTRIAYNVAYKNGEISDVIQCVKNQFNLDLKMPVIFCIHYLMVNGKLNSIITEYDNVSIEKLKTAYDRIHNGYIFNELYFEKDYEHFSKVYLSKNEKATIEYKKTELNALPVSLRKNIENKQISIREKTRKANLAQEEEAKKIEEAKKVTYDLEKYDKEVYSSFKTAIKDRIKEYVDSKSKNILYRRVTNSPYEYHPHESDMKYRFKNLYSAYYKLEDQSRPSQKIGNIYFAGTTNDIKSIKKFTLLSGTDTDCSIFNNICKDNIPPIKINGAYGMTEAKYDSINVDYYKGVTLVKVKNGNVEFLEYNPDADIAKKIQDKMKNEKNGRYIVSYYLSDIMGDKTEYITFEKSKFQLM